MGTVLQVPRTRLPEWPIAGPMLRTAGFHLAALATAPGAVDLGDFSTDAPSKVAL